MNNSQPLTNRQILVAKTHAAHEALHNHKAMIRLFAPDLSAGEYAKIVYAYLGFYQVLEHQRDALGCWPEFSLAKPIVQLQRDLATLGEHCHKDKTYESARSLPPEASASEFIFNGLALCELNCLAGLYVLHGARAGAAVIGKQLQSHHPHLPSHFFAAARDRVQWQQLLAVINNIHSGEGLDQLGTGAEAVFISFGRWLSASVDSH